MHIQFLYPGGTAPRHRALGRVMFACVTISVICASLLEVSWQVREAAVAAIPDTLNGRDKGEAIAYLPQLWKTCFLALDDLKGSVREAALPACRSLSDPTTPGKPENGRCYCTNKNAIGTWLNPIW